MGGRGWAIASAILMLSRNTGFGDVILQRLMPCRDAQLPYLFFQYRVIADRAELLRSHSRCVSDKRIRVP